MKLSLTRQQRKALFAGEHPRITVPQSRVGDIPREGVLSLSSKVSIAIVGLEDCDQGLNLHYVLKDDRPRLLRARTRSAGYEEGLRDDLTGAELVKASEASAYTHSPGAALRGSGEEVSRGDQERFKKESAAPAMQMLRQDRAELRAFVDRVRDNPLYQHGTGSIASELRFMERKGQKVLSKIEARINGEARRVA